MREMFSPARTNPGSPGQAIRATPGIDGEPGVSSARTSWDGNTSGVRRAAGAAYQPSSSSGERHFSTEAEALAINRGWNDAVYLHLVRGLRR
ncbi:hypothetical protein KM043_010836 [Ampulex compressa]|nr:hypothetical protein KM043_010836 [Ampulex compressa]